eukprot:310504_1
MSSDEKSLGQTSRAIRDFRGVMGHCSLYSARSVSKDALDARELEAEIVYKETKTPIKAIKELYSKDNLITMSLTQQYQLIYAEVIDINTGFINIKHSKQNINKYDKLRSLSKTQVWPFGITLTKTSYPWATKMSEKYPKLSKKMLKQYISNQSLSEYKVYSNTCMNLKQCCFEHCNTNIECSDMVSICNYLFQSQNQKENNKLEIIPILNKLLHSTICKLCVQQFLIKTSINQLFSLLHDICHQFESHYITLK